MKDNGFKVAYILKSRVSVPKSRNELCLRNGRYDHANHFSMLNEKIWEIINMINFNFS